MQRYLPLLLALSFGLNIYLLFFRAPTAEQRAGDKAAPVSGESGISVSDGAPPAQVAAAPGAEPTAGPAGVAPESRSGVADTAGTVVEPESGLRLLTLDVRGSLAQTFNEALGSENGDIVSAFFARIFMWKLDLKSDVYKADKIMLLYRILPELNTVDIPAAAYKSNKMRTTFQAFWYQPAGKRFGSYYDENGKEIPFSLVSSPIADYEQITALLKDRTRHNGMDFKAPVGAKIVSPFKGRVTRLNWNAPNGTCVEIEYADKTSAKFLHLNRILPGIVPGKQVQAGEAIAESGNTGHSTAPHLHYQLERPAGTIIDPLDYHGTTVNELSPAILPDFQKVRDRYTRHLQL
ncbi:MAG: M23 family metallopeptidase [Myxococcota bacterium]